MTCQLALEADERQRGELLGYAPLHAFAQAHGVAADRVDAFVARILGSGVSFTAPDLAALDSIAHAFRRACEALETHWATTRAA